MTVDERPPEPAAAPRPPADPALDQYRAQMRRARGGYYLVLAALAVVVLAAVDVAAFLR